MVLTWDRCLSPPRGAAVLAVFVQAVESAALSDGKRDGESISWHRLDRIRLFWRQRLVSRMVAVMVVDVVTASDQKKKEKRGEVANIVRGTDLTR